MNVMKNDYLTLPGAGITCSIAANGDAMSGVETDSLSVFIHQALRNGN
jgi:hypothetical protein